MALDRALIFQLDLLRLDAHTRAQVIRILEKMEKELIAQVADGVTDWSKARIAQQLAEAGAVIRRYYDEAAGVAFDTTTGVFQVSSTEAARTLAISSGSEPGPLPTAAMMETIAGNSVVQGATQGAWWKRQTDDVMWRFAAAIRQGLTQAETNAQIIKRVRTEMEITRANAAALVQTSVQTVANDARMKVFEDNADIIESLRWMSALDSHTCIVCAPRDGMTWTVQGKAIDASEPFANPPLHFNCRCVLVPETMLSNLVPGTRASMVGQVSSKTTFTDFLARQGKAFQDEVLGPGRAEMYRAGKITLQDLVTKGGRPLTLDQLREKYS